MAYRRKAAYSGRSRKQRNYGYEKARQHIEEANRLTAELGGTDKDVKKWFFSLNSSKREVIFKKYGAKYGATKEEYARVAFTDWKTGKKKMSGLVAERLFSLLPPMMPAKVKFELVENLWKHVGPSKKVLVMAGTNSPMETIINTVKEEVASLTTSWTVPEQMTKRFNWLAQNDSAVYQQLLAHIKQKEKELGETVLADHIPQLKGKFQNEIGETTSRLSYVIDVGKQMVELRLEGNGDTVEVVDWYTAGSKSTSIISKNSSWIWWILIGIAVIVFLNS